MIQSTQLAVTKVRTVIHENLVDRLEEGAALVADGQVVRVPRPGLWSEGGDYYEMAVTHDLCSKFPSCAVFCPSSRPAPGVTSQVIHQAHLVTVRMLDLVAGKADAGNVEALVRRLARYEAAIKDLFLWRKTRLQTLDVPGGVAVGVSWLSSRFPQEPGGVRMMEIDFSVRIHEDKGT